VYIHKQVFAEAKDPLSISFVFGLLGRCRVALTPPERAGRE